MNPKHKDCTPKSTRLNTWWYHPATPRLRRGTWWHFLRGCGTLPGRIVRDKCAAYSTRSSPPDRWQTEAKTQVPSRWPSRADDAGCEGRDWAPRIWPAIALAPQKSTFVLGPQCNQVTVWT